MARRTRSSRPLAAPAALPALPVRELMVRAVHACRPEDTLDVAARIMWEQDCGFVPVTDAVGRLCGVLTDRDACMAAWTQGRSLLAIPVAAAMATKVVVLHPDDPLERAHELLRTHRLRRLPVVDGDQHVVGVLSLKDLAAHARARPAAQAEVAETLVQVTRGRGLEIA